MCVCIDLVIAECTFIWNNTQVFDIGEMIIKSNALESLVRYEYSNNIEQEMYTIYTTATWDTPLLHEIHHCYTKHTTASSKYDIL